MVKKNASVFISGEGSNLKNLIKRSRDYNFPVKIKLVITNNSKAKGILYAKKNFIPYYIISSKVRNAEQKIINRLKNHKIQIILLAGYMKIFSKSFLNNYRKTIINVHPSLLPKFKGINTYSRIIKNKEKKTGCTVHFVTEKLDSGNVIVKKSFFIEDSDTELILKNKTQKLEYTAYPEAIIKVFRFFKI